jgi:D-serine deaminase-like pyridoxal phosphate-dependent protein
MRLGVYTEAQVGSYVVMDSEYHAIESSADVCFETALFVEATVIGDRSDGSVVVDAGQKALFRGGPVPVMVGARGKRLHYSFAGDEHGQLAGAPDDLPRLGERVRFELPHCDPNVALFDHIDAEEDGRCVDEWPIVARGVW